MRRRDFLKSVLALSSAVVLQGPAVAAPHRMLVEIHLFGGNDGLNTVVPLGDPRYARLRPALALRPDEVHAVGSGMALHGALAPLLPLWEAGRVAIVQGVGYPRPDHSHFRASEIWESAQPEGVVDDGWLGRYLDASGQAAVSVDRTLARALQSRRGHPLCVQAPDTFRFQRADAAFADHLDRMYAQPALPPHLAATWGGMRQAMRAVQGRRMPAGFPQTDFGKALATVLGLMPGAAVYHVVLYGFDTHANQKPRHAKVLGELAEGLAAFWRALLERGLDRRTLLVAWSEFGRRVEENASGGTDHGTAGAVLLMGGNVRRGLHGDPPSLADLEEGDLRYTVDFRRIYATVLERWLDADAEAVLGGRFDPLGIL